MKNTILPIIFSFIFVSAFSQKPAGSFSFKVDGTIRNFQGAKIYLHHKSNEKEITDSTKVASGKFTFNLKAGESAAYWFTLSREPNAQPNYMFFSDPGTIKVKIIADSMQFSSAEGGQSQRDYMEYRSFINNLIMIQQKMQADFNEAAQKGDMNAQNAIKTEYQNLNAQYIGGIKNFVKNHPKSTVSAYVIANDLSNPAIPVAELEEAIGLIDKSLEANSYLKPVLKHLEDLKGTTVGHPATNFSQTTPDGKKVSLSDFKGKYVLLDFWASWCKPCRMENPNVVAAYNRFKDKGFTVLGVSMDSNRDPWLAAIQQDGLTWTHVSDLKGWGNEVGKMYNVTGIPQNFLIDKEGKIVAKDLRGSALDEKLAEIIK
jgi:peroxiredoxin